MVKLRNCRWDELAGMLDGRRLYCFGGGNLAEWISYKVCGIRISDRIIAFVDNDERKSGTYIELDEYKIPVIPYRQFLAERDGRTVMLVTSMYYKEMIEQMDREALLDDMECYVEVFLEEDTFPAEMGKNNMEELIPKKIHYCWFGKKEIPDEYKRYMESWKKFCPDYEIIRWDESNYDYKKIAYTRQAYEAGKWAFVSDYARLDIVYNYGGIYLDVDVEVVKNLDRLLRNQMFCGFEQGHCVNTGLGIGAVKGFGHVRDMRDMYHEVPFLKASGEANLTACTKYQTDILVSMGLERNGRAQMVDGVRVYPRTVLAPLDFYGVHTHFSDDTHTIHHYAATWFQGKNSRNLLLQKNSEIVKRMKQNV